MLFQKIVSFFLSLVLFFSAGVGLGKTDVRTAREISSNACAQAGYRLTGLLLDDCCSLTQHTFTEHLGKGGRAYVWAAASMVETMADAYRLFPGSAKLRAYYTDALTRVLKGYLVEDAEVTVPAGVCPGQSYYNASAGNSGDYYYDDNEWVCIELLLGYMRLGKKELLEAARKNLEFLWTGWDDALGGGLYWSMACTSKNACANAPAAIAFLLAYQITGEETYLEHGKAIYDWMNGTMRENDLFIDAINVATGEKNHWKGVYNQATMIYAGSLLYEITGEEEYYRLTNATVQAVLPHMFTVTETETGETVKMHGNPIYSAWCVGWLARSFVKFYEVDPARDARPMALLKAVLEDELATKDENGLYDPFFCSGDANPEVYDSILAQSGVACTFLNAAYFDAAAGK